MYVFIKKIFSVPSSTVIISSDAPCCFIKRSNCYELIFCSIISWSKVSLEKPKPFHMLKKNFWHQLYETAIILSYNVKTFFIYNISLRNWCESFIDILLNCYGKRWSGMVHRLGLRITFVFFSIALLGGHVTSAWREEKKFNGTLSGVVLWDPPSSC